MRAAARTADQHFNLNDAHMLLIPTCSEDVTTDMLLPLLGEIDVFRFNIDKWSEYAWEFSNAGIFAQSPDGKILADNKLKCVYMRKPIFFDAIDVPANGCLENWCREEVVRLWQDLFYDMAARSRAALVFPAKSKWYKHTQMALASKYFKVPEWKIIRGFLPEALKSGKWVAKSLTQTQIGEGKIFLVREIDVDKIDPYYPWFLQRKIDAQYDLTAVFVEGEIFAFETSRSELKGEDVRINTKLQWDRTELSESELLAIKSFMKDTGFAFGRFDFLRKDGELIFLEMNPNGMWAWLDMDYKNGIFESVANAIKRKYNSIN